MINKYRRSFIQGSAVAGAASFSPLGYSALAQKGLDKLQQCEFPTPDFSSIEGDVVKIKCADNTVIKATVEEVSDIVHQAPRHQRPGYLRAQAKVVRFNVAGAENLSSDIHQVSHPKLGKFDLLLTVVPNASGVAGLEAIFN